MSVIKTEAKDGEFTLVYNLENKAHPVALSPDQHDKLQALCHALGKRVTVISDLVVKYEKT